MHAVFMQCTPVYFVVVEVLDLISIVGWRGPVGDRDECSVVALRAPNPLYKSKQSEKVASC